jgi:gamma-glutamylcyclotransferase (GGCT)/AIG2-like uncharacterized protein YtfP
MIEPATLVFVYGTLRREGSNHFRMERGRFVGQARVRGRLYRIDWYPGLVLDSGGGWIHGELFAVDAGLLAALDAFEGIAAGEDSGSEYRRIQVVADSDSGAVSAWAWEWVGAVDETRRLPGGDWIAVEA